jgi:hypothetical protein
MLKHFLVAAVVGTLSFVNIDRAHGAGFDDFFGAFSSWFGGSQNSTSSANQMSQDLAAVQADCQQLNQHLDAGDYASAGNDLNQLIQDRQQYYTDLQTNTSSAGSTSLATPMIVPITAQGKY